MMKNFDLWAYSPIFKTEYPFGARPLSPGAAGVTVKDSASPKSSEEKFISSTLTSLDASRDVASKDFWRGSKASTGAAFAVMIATVRKRHRKGDMERTTQDLSLT